MRAKSNHGLAVRAEALLSVVNDLLWPRNWSTAAKDFLTGCMLGMLFTGAVGLVIKLVTEFVK